MNLENLFKYFTKKENSKDVAKDRLKLVLIHDRSNMSPHLLEAMKADILKVILKYAEVEEAEIDIKMTQEKNTENDSSSALVASIPIIKLRVPKEEIVEEEKTEEIKKENKKNKKK